LTGPTGRGPEPAPSIMDGRIHIELLNGPMLFELKATPARLAHARPVRHLREVHPGRGGIVCVIEAADCDIELKQLQQPKAKT
jgi:hypothetical protein